MKARKIAMLLVLCLAVAILLPLTVVAAPDLQPKIPHTLEGRNNCTGCHTVGAAGVGAPGGTSLPNNHQGRTSDMCQGCHQPAAAAPQSGSADSSGTSGASAASASGASTGASQQAGTGSAQATQAQKQPEQQSGKLPTTGENDFQFVPIIVAAALLLVGGFALRKMVATR